MVGRTVSLRSERVALGVVDTDLVGTEIPQSHPSDAGIVLDLDGLTVTTRQGQKLLDHLDLNARRGEIVGIAGVEGNGQRTLADVLSSLLPLDAGEVLVDGTSVVAGKAGTMSAAGIGVIPEDRHDSGIVLEMTVAENLLLTDPAAVSTAGIMSHRALDRRAEQLIDEFDISCSGPDAPLFSLSGGNQQRVVLARELSQNPLVLVAAQPTRGLDVGAIEYMTDRLRRAAEDGVAILLISSELEEILDLAHRVVVMSAGRVIGEMAREDADLERIGLMMGGRAA